MNRIKRSLGMGLGLMLLGAAGPALAQEVAPPNIHFLLDTSSSMRELPQIKNSGHRAFFDTTVNGCQNPDLDTAEASHGWDPNIQYPVPDTGFPELFQDSKFYGYMFWNDSMSPAPQWDSKEEACQMQVPNWDTSGSADYNTCVTCLSTKGYWKYPPATQRDTAPYQNRDFIFWGRFLNFNPPKYVAAKAALKQTLKNLQSARAGLSIFTATTTLTTMLEAQNSTCSDSLYHSDSFATYSPGYIDDLNQVTFTTGTPLAKSLLNVGYYFTSDIEVYRTNFGFGSSYNYPAEFQNAPLTSNSRSVCWGCQTNAVVIISDGEPSGDAFTATMADKMRTVNGGPTYCPDSAPCNSGTTNASRDMGTSPTSYTDDNPNYYLDDVAKMLYQRDLQQSSPEQIGGLDTSGQQSVATYTVGFGVDSNLLKNTAAVGGGLYFTVDNAPALQQALQSIISDVQARSVNCIHTPGTAP